jgi:hypothetical protein
LRRTAEGHALVLEDANCELGKTLAHRVASWR